MPKKDNLALIRTIQQKVAASDSEDPVTLIPQSAAPVSPPTPASGLQLQRFSPRVLLDNPFQARVDYRNIEALADKMRSQGFVGSLIARKAPAQKGYLELAFGHRRRRAAEIVGIDIPVEVRDLTDQDMILYAASENLEREDLTALEEGIMFLRMNRDFKMTQEEIAQFVGEERKKEVKRGYVRERLELAQLAEEQVQVRQFLEHHPGASIRAMRSLGGLEEAHIAFLLHGIQAYEWTGEQVEQRARILKEGGDAAEALLSPGESQQPEKTPALQESALGDAKLGRSGAGDQPGEELGKSSDKIHKEIDRSVLLSGAAKRVRRFTNSPDTGTLSDHDLGVLQEIATSVVVVMAARSTSEQKHGALQEIADLIQELLSQTETAKT